MLVRAEEEMLRRKHLVGARCIATPVRYFPLKLLMISYKKFVIN
jgi:hypothetical protein